jgi:hypothetical protein
VTHCRGNPTPETSAHQSQEVGLSTTQRRVKFVLTPSQILRLLSVAARRKLCPSNPPYSMFLITREVVMKNQLSLKFAALAVALLMNGLIIGGVSYVFNGQIHQRSGDSLVAHAQI